MTDYTRPSDLPAWAESGDKVQPTNPEIQTGWPVSDVPPSRQRFNWLFNWLANAVRYVMQLGIPEWSATETYRTGSRVQYSGVAYKALAASTNITPGTDATKWEKWGFLDSELQPRVDKVLTKSVAGNVDVTLTATEADNGIIILTGALTGNINVIFPNAGRRWVVFNNTSGSYTLGAKTAAGSAVSLTQGKSVSIYCDGANGVRVSGAANDVSFVKTSFTATAGQTVFTGLSYTVGNIWVDRNGVAASFTGTNGTSITLTTPANLNDLVEVYQLNSFNVANALPLSGGTLSGPLAMSGAAINEAQGSNIASAATVNLDSATGNYVHITGTTGITAITLSQGRGRTVVFDGALTLTNGASLILPGGANITTAAGDSAIFRGEAGGVVRCVGYFTAGGGSFTITGTGFTVNPTATATYKIINGIVFMSVPSPSIVGTSNATSFTLTGLPAAITPSATRNVGIASCNDAGAATWADVSISNTGVITLSKTGNGAAWTASGSKSLRMSEFVYSL